jgi:hypothetical protein
MTHLDLVDSWFSERDTIYIMNYVVLQRWGNTKDAAKLLICTCVLRPVLLQLQFTDIRVVFNRKRQNLLLLALGVRVVFKRTKD